MPNTCGYDGCTTETPCSWCGVVIPLPASSYSPNKDVRQLLEKVIEHHKARPIKLNGGHIAFVWPTNDYVRHPDGRKLIVSSTPRSPASVNLAAHDLRKAGALPPETRAKRKPRPRQLPVIAAEPILLPVRCELAQDIYDTLIGPRPVMPFRRKFLVERVRDLSGLPNPGICDLLQRELEAPRPTGKRRLLGITRIVRELEKREIAEIRQAA